MRQIKKKREGRTERGDTLAGSASAQASPRDSVFGTERKEGCESFECEGFHPLSGSTLTLDSTRNTFHEFGLFNQRGSEFWSLSNIELVAVSLDRRFTIGAFNPGRVIDHEGH